MYSIDRCPTNPVHPNTAMGIFRMFSPYEIFPFKGEQ